MRGAVIVLAVALGSCAGSVEPAGVEPEHDTCRFCRMPVSEPRLAAQLVAPAEEPLFFDDIGCLAQFLLDGNRRPGNAVAFVADHRTLEWLRADVAVYARVPSIATPMGSHLVAYRDRASLSADLGTRDHEVVPPGDVLGTALSPRSGR